MVHRGRESDFAKYFILVGTVWLRIQKLQCSSLVPPTRDNVFPLLWHFRETGNLCDKENVTCMGDYRRGFGLDIGFLDHLYTRLISTSNYSATVLTFNRLHGIVSQKMVVFNTEVCLDLVLCECVNFILGFGPLVGCVVHILKFEAP
jgi:hypothetical protein